MSVNRNTEIWREIKPFAIRDLNAMFDQAKSGSGAENLYAIALHDVSTKKIKYYSVTVAGLQGAVAAAGAGDVIIIPVGTLQLDFTLPANVSMIGISRSLSILWGTVTLSDGSSLANLTVLKEESSASAIAAVVGAAGASTVKDCVCEAFNCGSGNAVGISAASGAAVVVERVTARGESGSGDGYGIDATGTTTVRECSVFGSTAMYNGAVNVHGNVESASAISLHCIAPDTYIRGYLLKQVMGDSNLSGIVESGEDYESAGAAGRSENFYFYTAIGYTDRYYRREIDLIAPDSTSAEYVSDALLTGSKKTILDDDVFFFAADGSSSLYFGLYKMSFATGTKELIYETLKVGAYGTLVSIQSVDVCIHAGSRFVIVSLSLNETAQSKLGAFFIILNYETDDIETSYVISEHDNSITAQAVTGVEYGDGQFCVLWQPSLSYSCLITFLDLDDFSTTVTQVQSFQSDYAYGYFLHYFDGDLFFKFSNYNIDQNGTHILKINVASKAVTHVVYLGAATAMFCYGNERLYIGAYTTSVVWTDTDLVEVGTTLMPAAVRFDDVEQRIWYWDTVNAKLVGMRVTDGATREVSLSLAVAPVSSISLYNLLDHFFLEYTTSSVLYRRIVVGGSS